VCFFRLESRVFVTRCNKIEEISTGEFMITVNSCIAYLCVQSEAYHLDLGDMLLVQYTIVLLKTQGAT